jgi:hypothetical protein
MRLRSVALLSVILAVALGASGSSRARCGTLHPFLVPHAGALPRNPTLHLFYPASDPDAVPRVQVRDASGRALRFDASKIDGAQLLRIEIETRGAASIEVSFRTDEDALRKVVYRIDPSVRGAAAVSPRILSVSESSYSWSCSWEALQALALDVKAPLFRVEWAESEAAFAAGSRRTILLPHRFGDLAFLSPETHVPESAVLPLGDMNCAPSTLEWKGPIWAAVAAMYPDGSQTPLSEPLRIDPPSDPFSPGHREDEPSR